MIALLIVSHSWQVAQGVKTLADQIAQASSSPVIAVGGLDPDTLGTDAARVRDAIVHALHEGADAVLVLMDIGSSVLGAQTALDQLSAEQRARVRLCDAPLIEGAIVAAVEASLGRSPDEIQAAAELAGHISKFDEFPKAQ